MCRSTHRSMEVGIRRVDVKEGGLVFTVYSGLLFERSLGKLESNCGIGKKEGLGATSCPAGMAQLNAASLP